MDKEQYGKLSELISVTQSNEKHELSEEYKALSLNIQRALSELGFNVTLIDAMNLWEAYSLSMNASWLSGSESVSGAKEFIETFLDDVYGDIC